LTNAAKHSHASTIRVSSARRHRAASLVADEPYT
jgi:signal transduction histidine kinase